jgi:hypothetical protein
MTLESVGAGYATIVSHITINLKMGENMKQILLYFFILLFSLIFSISCSDKKKEKEIAISELPTLITSAIQDTLPGFKIIEAEIESKEDQITYELDGIFKDKKYEIEVSSDGEIIEIEEEESDSHDQDEESDEHDKEDDD